MLLKIEINIYSSSPCQNKSHSHKKKNQISFPPSFIEFQLVPSPAEKGRAL